MGYCHTSVIPVLGKQKEREGEGEINKDSDREDERDRDVERGGDKGNEYGKM